jgi:hypothetical protein
LQAPSFLYLVEVGEPDPSDPSRRILTGYETAARMSFFMLGTTPDDDLLDAAERGDLSSTEGIRAMASELVHRPEAVGALDAFYEERLRLRDLDSLVKVPAAFPALGIPKTEAVSVGPYFADSARGETLAFIRDVVWARNADYRDLFTADYTFANAVTAFFYVGGELPENISQIGELSRLEWPPEQERAGLLGQVSLLVLLARSDRTSPTLRGKFVRETFMCDVIPPPPPDVKFDLPPDAEAPTMRAKLLAHQTNPSCAGCHVFMDNVGFALEHFDGAGFYRTEENGVPIDATGEIDGLGSFDGARELGALLRDAPAVHACTVKQLFRHAAGHLETPGELVSLDAVTARFADGGYRLRDLLVEVVASDAFRFVQDPPVE